MSKEELQKRILEVRYNLVSAKDKEFIDVLEELAIKALEQEPILDKIRAEIAEYGSIMVAYAITKNTKTDKGIEKLVSDVLKQAKEQVLEIIDKYRKEQK